MQTMRAIDRVTLSITETAAALGVSRPTVYALLHKRGFPAFKVGGRTLVSAEGWRGWVAAKAGGEKSERKEKSPLRRWCGEAGSGM